MLSQKLVYLTTDACAKVLKFGRLLEGKFPNFVSIVCDSHITQSALEDTKDSVSFFQNSEDQVMDLYKIVYKNSALARKELAQYSKELQEKTLASRTVFKIRFADSDRMAMKAALVDHEQNIKIATERSTNTNYSAKLQKA